VFAKVKEIVPIQACLLVKAKLRPW